MRNTKIKIGALIFLLFFFNSCGFKPMYKISESRIDFKSYSIIIVNESNISREIKEEIRKSFPSSSEVNKDYVIEINATETLDPLITNTDGTVAKYRIEIVIIIPIICLHFAGTSKMFWNYIQVIVFYVLKKSKIINAVTFYTIAFDV